MCACHSNAYKMHAHTPIACIVLAAMAIALAFATPQRAKDNGDIYVVNITKFVEDAPPMNATIMLGVLDEVYTNEYDDSSSKYDEEVNAAEHQLELYGSDGAQTNANATENGQYDEIVAQCNSSFSVPMESLLEFNSNGALLDEVDKTGLCFIRCFYEKSGLISNWQLNAQMIRDAMWPATGDSIEFCQRQGANETNACIRTYAIAKCLTTRAIVDARNKPMV